MSRSMRWRIAVPYVVLILIATLGLSLYLSEQMRQVRLADLEEQFVADARLLADSLARSPGQLAGAESLDAQARHWADILEARVTLINADGRVLGESHEDRAQMDNHLGRPEVQGALKAGSGTSIRYSATIGYEMMYGAVPIQASSDASPAGFARLALSLRPIESDIRRLRQRVLWAGLVTAGIAGLLALFIAERAARPLRQLTEAARRIAEGDLSTRLTASRSDEVGQLTKAFQHMAEQLQEKMSTLAGERGRLAAVLEHMADGVLIADDSGRVQLVNPAAERLLGTNEEKSLGRTFGQVVQQHQIIDLWRRCRESGEEQEDTIEIGHRHLWVRAIMTPFPQGEARGFLVILQDFTSVRRLETVRRDFIANVSHELRTPLAGLKALVDTLRGPALADPPAAQRFLKSMDSEVDALTQTVEELLELSRIESGRVPLRLAPTPLSQVVAPPTERLRAQAEGAGLELSLRLPSSEPLVLADVERMQKVVTNLVHNAIKFTPSGGRIVVSAAQAGDEVVVSVQDSGVGIGAEDLPRIFERFYKGDRARSGGGTGLGLAIAKHIVQGHGGRIWVESIEGQGSIFYFSLTQP